MRGHALLKRYSFRLFLRELIDRSVFLTNTRPNLVQALGTCLRAHFGRR